MKSKWKKRFLVAVGCMLIGAVLIAALFFGRGSQFKQPFQNVMTPIMQQGDYAVGQFQQKFRGGMGHGDPAVVTRGHGGQGMNHFAPHDGGRGRGHHHGGFGFGIGSLLTLAFWGGLLVLAVTWWKKRKSGRIGQNVILDASATLALPDRTNTNAAFLDQWEKEQYHNKEEN